jgi:hypothetical protein
MRPLEQSVRRAIAGKNAGVDARATAGLETALPLKEGLTVFRFRTVASDSEHGVQARNQAKSRCD